MSSQEFEGADGAGGDRDNRDGAGGYSGDEVAGYAAEVRAQFADLPDADSADLLEDLEDHLREVAAEGAGTLRERLGAPAAYARELRQAAGLPEPGEGSGSGGSGSGARARRTLRSRVRQAIADAERRARGYRAGREVLDFVPSLRPAWWVLRAWVAVRLLEVMTTSVNPWHDFALVPQVGNSTLTGLLALLVAVPASVYAARRTVPEGWRRRAMGAGEGILVLFTIGMALSSIGGQNNYGDTASGVSYVQPGPQSGLAEGGNPISNLFVYDLSGKLLDGVYIYDQDGHPVNVTRYADGPDGPVVANDGWLDGDGALVPNIFPQQVLRQQWSDAYGYHLVAVPPPLVNVPQGVHRASAPTTAPSTPTTSPSTSPSTAQAPSSGAPTSTPSTPPPTGATGAHMPSAPLSTPAPTSTTG